MLLRLVLCALAMKVRASALMYQLPFSMSLKALYPKTEMQMMALINF